MVADVAAAEQFGPYLVYERLGVGGMATVHRALERGIEGFERFVALKRLLPHLASDASFIKSFVREAKLASLLNHVNIVQIFELGRVGTEYFISMEYIDGRDIRRLLRHARKVTGPPPIHITVGLLLQLCEALDYAHTRVDEHGVPMGLVHRDVSPSNLLITQAGHLKVIDFGIAKAQSSQLRTQTGRVKGKLAYMAPEAIAGKDLDARSDLFAVGVIAHELLTARPLFASKNEYQTLLKVQRGDIMPPSTFNQACPAELDALVLKALARDPNERFSSAAELRDALHAMRRRYDLQTGHRDVAQWVEWAFSVEPPSGGFAGTTLDQTGVGSGNVDLEIAGAAPGARSRTASVPPKLRRDEDDAVEIAWGGGEGADNADPVVLEDVPDVSDKHRALAADAQISIDDLDDDIPAPQPSHGRMPRARAIAAATMSAATLPGTPALPSSAVKRTTAPGVAARPAAARAPTIDTGPAERTSNVFEPRAAHSLTNLTPARDLEPAHPASDVAPSPAETMRNLPPLASARVRAGSVAPRDLPTLEPAAGAWSGDEHYGDEREDSGGRGLGRAVDLGDVGDSSDAEGTVLRPRSPAATYGHGGASAAPADAAPAAPAPKHTASFTAPSTTIGAAMVARQSGGRRWLAVVGLLAVALAVGAVLFVMNRGTKAKPEVTDDTPRQPARTTGTVKFATVPEDAEITVQGQPVHQGSPWVIDLAAGVHQISIHRSGYKAWLTSLELSANETTVLRVVLEPLGGPAASAEATLVLSTTPSGLEVVLDGQLLPQRTPIKMPIKPGPHTIVVRQNGTEVWRHQLDAQPSVDYEFTPSMTEDKQRERAERSGSPQKLAASRVADSDRNEPSSDGAAGAAGAAGSDERTIERTTDPPADRTNDRAGDRVIEKPESPTLPSIPSSSPASGSQTTGASGAQPGSATDSAGAAPAAAAIARPVSPSVPAPPIDAAGPILVAPTAVTRIGGETPSVGKSKRGEVPPVVAAKVCIDKGGRVSSVDVLTKLERMTVIDLTNALKSWTYQPYKHNGTAAAACFVVSFRVK